MIDELKSKFKGRVSFLKSMKSIVKKKFVGSKKYWEVKTFYRRSNRNVQISNKRLQRRNLSR